MRYIRVKSGIYRPKDIQHGHYICKYNRIFIESEIIKQNDDIEKICDYSVYITEVCENWIGAGSKQLHIFNLSEHTESASSMAKTQEFFTQDHGKEKVVGRYLAILTDKGLMYVASVSEKGKIRLL